MKRNELTAHKADVYIPVYGSIADAEVYLKEKVDAILAEKDAEIESLKASHYAEMVDAGMLERRLKRALYIVLARLFCCMRELAARNALYDDECKWDNFKTTCLKKAEEYR